MWDDLVKVTESLYKAVVSEQDLDYAQACLVSFQRQFEDLFPEPTDVVFNQHYAFHFAADVRAFGSFYVYHCFGNERFVGLAMSIHNDGRHPQSTVILAWVDYQDLVFWCDLQDVQTLDETASNLRNQILQQNVPMKQTTEPLDLGRDANHDYTADWYRYAHKVVHTTGCEALPGSLLNKSNVRITEVVRGYVLSFLRGSAYRNQGHVRVGGVEQCAKFSRMLMFGTTFGSVGWNDGATADVMVRFSVGAQHQWYWYVGQVQSFLKIPVGLGQLPAANHYFAHVRWYEFKDGAPSNTIAEIRLRGDFADERIDPIIPLGRIACGCVRLPREDGTYQISALPDLLTFTHLDDPYQFDDM